MTRNGKRGMLLWAAVWLMTAICAAQAFAASDEIQVNAVYRSLRVSEPVECAFPYSDAWFSGDASVYNHQLARGSLGLALSAYRDTDAPLEQRDRWIVSFLEKLGFQDIRTYQYDLVPSEHTIGSALAYRQMDGFVLVAAPVSGGGYENEWLSNLNVGDETRHTGFDGAARTVEARIREYLAEKRFAEPVKLWCAGYSRAAAVSNLVAADFMEEGLFEDIFAYTFATPRNTREPKPYPNIFSIIGKNDPVTAIPLADWGYGRNGVELFTPAQEYDSSFAQSADAAEKVSRTVIGEAFRNNPEINADLRTVLDYILQLMPTAADYKESLYPSLTSVWTATGRENIVRTLSEALSRMQNLSEEEQELVTEFINYLSTLIYARTAGGDTRGEREYGRWDSDAPLADNIVHEHSPDVYVAWMLSEGDPEALFTDGASMTRLCVSGDVTLDIYDEYGFVQRVGRNGEIVTEPPEEIVSLRQTDRTPLLYAVRQGTQTIVCLPRDRSYVLSVKSEADQEISYFGTACSTRQIRGEITKKYSLRMNRGDDCAIISFNEASEEEPIAGIDRFGKETWGENVVYSPSLILAMEKANVLELDISTIAVLAMLITAAVALLVFLTIVFAVIRLIRKKKRSAAAAIITHTVTAYLCFLLEEGARYYWQGIPMLMTFMKGLTSLTILLLCLKGVRRKKRRADLFVCGGLMICGIADMLMNRRMGIATALYVTADLLYTAGFVYEARPRLWQYITGAVLFVGFAACILRYRVGSPVPVWSVALFALVLSAMTASSLRTRPLLAAGTVIFAASTVLMCRNLLIGETYGRHFVSLGLFYLSELVMASAVWLGKPRLNGNGRNEEHA